ncbi:MAG: insulinase family protein [Chitinophagaceae bacterium]
MKNKIFKISNMLTITMLLLAVNLSAQVDRTKAPKAGPAPLVKVGTPATFTLPNGLKVFVVQNNKLPRVSASLSLDLDPLYEGDKAGCATITGQLMSQGSKTKGKDALDEEVDFLGANLSTTATSAFVNSLSNNFNNAFALMADVVLNPAFDKEELAKIKKRTISGLQTQKDDAKAISRKVSNVLMYGVKHPYGEFETEKSVESIEVSDVKKYYNTYWKPNAAYLIFVGDITLAKAQALATKHFAKWQKGVLPKTSFNAPKPAAKTFIAIVDRPSSVQSVISINAPVQLKPGSADAIPASVMNSVLGGSATARLFMNLREKHGFTYGAYSSLSEDKLVGSFKASASVRNEKTDSAIQEFLNEFKRIKNTAVDAAELTTIKNYMNGSFARSLESPSTIAEFALDIARYKLPANYYQQYLTNLGNVTAANVQQMANKYVMPNNLYIVIVGNAKEIAKGLDKYGEVKYFDIDGNETKPATTKAVDASITGESIIKKYITAVGGDAAIATVKDIDMSGSAKIEGAPMDFAVSQKYILSKSFAMSMSAGPMTIFSQSAKEGVYAKSQQGQNVPVEEDEKEELDEETYFVNEVYYLKNKYSFTVKGIESVDGKDAYVVEIKSAKDRTFTNYYDVETGLKIKNSHIEDAGPQGKMNLYTTYGNYKTYNGLQIPTEIVSFVGVKISINIKDVKVNTGLKAEDLK